MFIHSYGAYMYLYSIRTTLTGSYCISFSDCMCINYEPTGELSGPGAELLVRFHTSSEERARYTIQTLGNTDMIVALLGPDDYTNVITLVNVFAHGILILYNQYVFQG